MKKALLVLTLAVFGSLFFVQNTHANYYDEDLIEDQREAAAYQRARASNPSLTPEQFDDQQDLIEDQREAAAYQRARATNPSLTPEQFDDQQDLIEDQREAAAYQNTQALNPLSTPNTQEPLSSTSQNINSQSGDLIAQAAEIVDLLATGSCEVNGQTVSCQEMYQTAISTMNSLPFLRDFINNPFPLLIGVIVGVLILGIVSILCLVFWILMLIDAFTYEKENRILWGVILLIGGIVAAIVYYFLVKRPRKNKQNTDPSSHGSPEVINVD